MTAINPKQEVLIHSPFEALLNHRRTARDMYARLRQPDLNEAEKCDRLLTILAGTAP